MLYTTQGLMTSADMADMADLYDWNAGQEEDRAEEEAMEKAHEEHAADCRACQEEATQRETGARVALAMDDARRTLEAATWKALAYPSLPLPVRRELEKALRASQAALRSI